MKVHRILQKVISLTLTAAMLSSAMVFPAGAAETDETQALFDSLADGAAFYEKLEGEDRIFDGTESIDITDQIDTFSDLDQGTVIIRAKFTGDTSDTNGIYTLLGLQNSNNAAASHILFGSHLNGSTMVPRYEMTNSLYSSAASNVSFLDNEWHTLVFNFSDSDTTDGIWVSGDGTISYVGSSGHYDSSSWDGFMTRNTDMASAYVGDIAGATQNTNGVTYLPWLGEIDYVLITDELLTADEANDISSMQGDEITISISNTNCEFAAGSTVGTLSASGKDVSEVAFALVENSVDNHYFVIEDDVLMVGEEDLKPLSSYTVEVTCGVDGQETRTFTVSTRADSNLPFIDESEIITLGGTLDTSYELDSAVVSSLAASYDFTIMLQSVANDGLGSYFSLAQGSSYSNHFQLYHNGGTLGFELRGTGAGDIHVYASNVLRADGVNTVAFKADSSDYTLKLFANGKLVATAQYTEETFYSLCDVPSADTAYLGTTVRYNAGAYLTTGLITDVVAYGKALSDDEIIEYTSATPVVDNGYDMDDQPFVAGDDFGSQYFRIPALYTMDNGEVAAAIDIRFASTFDAPNNLDTGLRIKDVNGEWGDALLVNYFGDYANASGYTANSACFIDPALVQGNDGRLYVYADAWPSGGGLFGSYASLYGNGCVTVDGEVYIGLSDDTNNFTSLQDMPYYFKPVDADEATDDLKYRIYSTDTNEATIYTLNGLFELYKDGVAQYIDQLNSSGVDTGVDVPANIFYDASEFTLYPVGYLYIVTSDDYGVTWNDPQLIVPDAKTDDMKYFIAGPGRGLTLQNGPYADRVLFTTYAAGSDGAERSGTVYTDDNGETWHAGETTTMASTNSPGKSSEAQLIEFADGTVRIFARGNAYNYYIGYADSFDGGASFEPMQQDFGLDYCGNCMISIINYSGQIDGKDVVILSSPTGTSRANGVIRIGLIEVDESVPEMTSGRYSIDWAYEYSVNDTSFAYSCLTELPNGDIAILYEGESSTPIYMEYTLEELMNPQEEDESTYTITTDSDLVAGEEVEFVLTMSTPVAQALSALENTVLEITVGTLVVEATYASLSEDQMSITYVAILPEAEADYAITVNMPYSSSLVVLDGFVATEDEQALSGSVVAIVDATAAFSLSDFTAYGTDETATLTLNLDEAALGLTGYKVEIDYTAAAAYLTFAAGEAAQTTTGFQLSEADGIITITAAGGTTSLETGALATITFDVRDVSTVEDMVVTTITLSADATPDEDFTYYDGTSQVIDMAFVTMNDGTATFVNEVVLGDLSGNGSLGILDVNMILEKLDTGADFTTEEMRAGNVVLTDGEDILSAPNLTDAQTILSAAHYDLTIDSRAEGVATLSITG